MQKLVKTLLPFCFLLFYKPVIGQDIRAAWIEHKWLYGYTYSITAVILSDVTIDPNNHCKIIIHFGDGDSTVAIRQNGVSSPSSAQCPFSYNGVIISTSPPILRSNYSGIHTYNGPGNYTVNFSETFRTNGIKNLVNSGVRSIYCETHMYINSFSGPNSTPAFSVPTMTTSEGIMYNYNFSLYDPDGADSISYHLINCESTPLNSYYIPANANIDIYGTLTYQADTVGLYAFKILVKEWRSLQLIGSSEIDFTIEVKASVGIDEIEKQKVISLYPNPSSTELNIKTKVPYKEIEIFDLMGQLIYKRNFSETIDVSSLGEGCYTLKLIGKKTLYSKFIKN